MNILTKILLEGNYTMRHVIYRFFVIVALVGAIFATIALCITWVKQNENKDIIRCSKTNPCMYVEKASPLREYSQKIKEI